MHTSWHTLALRLPRMAWCKYDWDAVRAYRAAGHTIKECGERFGFSEDAWYKAIARGVVKAPKPKQNRGAQTRYDWDAVQRYYDEGHTYRECRTFFGFAATTWQLAVKRGAITARGQRWPIAKLLNEGRCNSSIKHRLVTEGLLEEKCSECGLTEWRGKKLCVQLDHINGINTDNRLENLRMLCPNCHSQTETFGTRNWIVQKRSRAQRESERGSDVVAPTRIELVSPG